MPVLNTLRQEVVCRLVSEGKTYTHAAVAAGYSKRSASCLGSQLMHQTHIRHRVLELRAAKPETTRESVMSALVGEGVFCIEPTQASAARQPARSVPGA
jgi:phage terminase small subunit